MGTRSSWGVRVGDFRMPWGDGDDAVDYLIALMERYRELRPAVQCMAHGSTLQYI